MSMNHDTPTRRTCFLFAPTQRALSKKDEILTAYENTPLSEADVLVPLGGDGFMLQTIHANLNFKGAFYGMNLGTVGFLMNKYNRENLMERIASSKAIYLRPLEVEALDREGRRHHAIAINEVSLLRSTHQTAKLRISIGESVRLKELFSDGLLVSTPAGSTAYNFAVYGPIMPLGSKLLALTPISAFRPRRWRGALIPEESVVDIEVLESDKRPVTVVADFIPIQDVASLRIRIHAQRHVKLLFDSDYSLEERVIREQFS